ncbi:putative RNA editing complex protein [Trypanosoma cruzi]|nr:putative RNA editing complex protein [Trypanosoma cruzi]
MRRGVISYAVTDHATRALTLPLLLDTVRRDPGMTAAYYANRYFGKERQMEVTRVLWGELKFYGQVTIDRIDGPEEPPRWYPVFSIPRKIHNIRRHCAEEEDLSILQQDTALATGGSPVAQEASASMAASVENSIIALVQKSPGHDIQFYIGEIPAVMQAYAPMAFRRLREAGVIVREQTPQGTFVWR